MNESTPDNGQNDMPDKNSSTAKTKENRQSFIAPWLSYRRKRFWAWVAVLAYTLVGFFLVPVLVQHFAVKAIHESTGRDATIADVRVNPYVLSMEVSGFELKDSDDVRMASFDRFFVNFQASSLFRWAWTFREISLDGAHLLYERFSPEDSRLSRLLNDIEQRAEAVENTETGGELPRMLVAQLSLNDGSMMIRDHMPGETVGLEAGPVSVSVQDLNTLPDRDGSQSVQVSLADGAALTWQGSLRLQPLHSVGELSLDDLELARLTPYLSSMMPLETFQARLSVRTDYELQQQGDEPLSVRLSSMESHLEEMALSGLTPSSEFFTLKSLDLTGGELRYPENTFSLESARIIEPFVDAWLGEDGNPGLLQLVPENSDPAPASDSSTAWTISVAEVLLESGRVALSDRSVEPNAGATVENLQVKLSGINNRDNTQIPITARLDLAEGGNFGFEGEIVALPGFTLSGTASAEGIALPLAQPYAQQQLAIAIEDGAFHTTTKVTLDEAGGLKADGELNITNLQVKDTLQNESLLAWENMKIDRFEVDLDAASAQVSTILFTRPYGRIEVQEDLSTNVGSIMISQGDGTEAPTQDEAGNAGWSAVIGGIAVEDGSMDFSDYSLFLPFSTQITSLNGTISTIDNQSTEPANIRLEGQVSEYGLSRIEGSMNLLDPIATTDVSVEFRNLEMTDLSPYSAEFAGREIDAGKLDLDLLYVIDGGQLAGQNAVVLSDLVLGDEVDNPDAVSLPLGLAVALLKNSEGVIDIELPVEGDINDPEFKIGGVVWKAFTTLITKIVSAPFKLLGSLIGVESEDLGQFQFLAGRSDLTPPELEKIAQLQQAMAQRPELAVKISGVYDPAIDTPALQFLSLRDEVFTRLGRDPTEEGSASTMLDDEIRGLLEVLYQERFPESPLENLKASHSAPPADDPEGKPELDETAYSGALRDRLIESQPIGLPDLQALANQRSKVVLDTFLSGGLDPARAQQGEPTEIESEDGEWVVMELGVAVD